MSSEPAAFPTHSPKLFLCGGGTGGHVYPALAAAAALQERVAHAAADFRLQIADCRLGQPVSAQNPKRPEGTRIQNLQLVYIGSVDGMEAGLVAQESDLPFRAIPAAALRGRSPLALASNLGTLARGTQVARRLIARERPLAILGTGGYVCVPLFLAARAARVPAAIYLPDVVPGLAVRFLARLSTTVACNVEDSSRYFRLANNQRRATNDASGRRSFVFRPSSFVVTGYPVRRELFEQDRTICRAAFGLDERLPVLLVYGGSRGARSINRAIAALLPHLLPIVQVLHVCGREGDESWLRAAVAQLSAELQARYKLYPYLFSGEQRVERGERREESSTQSSISSLLSPASKLTMVQAFGAADLALCRSGASTLGELPAAGLPAVLVPYPYVYQDENADYLVRHGAAIKVRDDEMLGDGRPEAGPLFQNLLRLVGDTYERATMSEHSKALAQPDAAGRLADLLLALAISKRPTS
jgi:UDP-N-acetylglucosamine--N-acetylmuramyl-(pentapeptide) pyrophosphoryl-undecaprenol N-acetylglucosamine transferase